MIIQNLTVVFFLRTTLPSTFNAAVRLCCHAFYCNTSLFLNFYVVLVFTTSTESKSIAFDTLFNFSNSQKSHCWKSGEYEVCYVGLEFYFWLENSLQIVFQIPQQCVLWLIGKSLYLTATYHLACLLCRCAILLRIGKGVQTNHIFVSRFVFVLFLYGSPELHVNCDRVYLRKTRLFIQLHRCTLFDSFWLLFVLLSTAIAFLPFL